MSSESDDPDAKLTALDDKIARLKARKQKLLNRRKAEERKRDSQRKIVIGGTLMKHAELNPEFHAEMWRILDAHVDRPYDRELLGLAPGPQDNAAPESEAETGPGHAWDRAAGHEG
jgi:large subunit ribosomal protein L7/L12